MYSCITVTGYLALFDIKESSSEYLMNRNLAKSIVERNKGRLIPLVISHLNYRVDLTIGYVTDLAIDNKGLFCKGVIDNCAFIETQNDMNENFIRYFTTATPSPFLYLKSCLPNFSLSHNRNTLMIKHVALVDVGARRGTLVTYEFLKNKMPKQYTNTEKDFYVVLACYTRNTIKVASERNNLLFKDILLCDETDTDFITAGKECEKKSIKTNLNSSLLEKTQAMSDSNNMMEAVDFLTKMASVLKETRGRKRPCEYQDEEPEIKKRRMNDEPILHASQTFSSSETRQQDQDSSMREEMNKFRDEMKQWHSEMMTTQANLFKDLMKQNLKAQLDNGVYPNNIQNSANFESKTVPTNYNQYIPPNHMTLHQHSSLENHPKDMGNTMIPPQPQSVPSQFSSQPNFQHLINQQQVSQIPVQHNTLGGVPVEKPLPSVPIAQSSGTASTSMDNDTIANGATEVQSNADGNLKGCESFEDPLIQAGLPVNDSEHLINELFRLFIKNNFKVKQI